MCNPKYQFKLCTCNDNSSSKARWFLRRFNDSDWFNMEQGKGRCFHPKYTNINESTGQEIFEELNNNNCFDFEFIPEEGDILNIILSISGEELPYEFIYQANKWSMENSISSHLNKQYIIKRGTIKS